MILETKYITSIETTENKSIAIESFKNSTEYDSKKNYICITEISAPCVYIYHIYEVINTEYKSILRNQLQPTANFLITIQTLVIGDRYAFEEFKRSSLYNTKKKYIVSYLFTSKNSYWYNIYEDCQ